MIATKSGKQPFSPTIVEIGIEFIDENDGGPGVPLRKTATEELLRAIA